MGLDFKERRRIKWADATPLLCWRCRLHHPQHHTFSVYPQPWSKSQRPVASAPVPTARTRPSTETHPKRTVYKPNLLEYLARSRKVAVDNVGWLRFKIMALRSRRGRMSSPHRRRAQKLWIKSLQCFSVTNKNPNPNPCREALIAKFSTVANTWPWSAATLSRTPTLSSL